MSKAINYDTQRLPLLAMWTSAVFIKVVQVSCNFQQCFETVLLQDTRIQQNWYLGARCSYFRREVSYCKIILLVSVSRYYLHEAKIRYCSSLLVTLYPALKRAMQARSFTRFLGDVRGDALRLPCEIFFVCDLLV